MDSESPNDHSFSKDINGSSWHTECSKLFILSFRAPYSSFQNISLLTPPIQGGQLYSYKVRQWIYLTIIFIIFLYLEVLSFSQSVCHLNGPLFVTHTFDLLFYFFKLIKPGYIRFCFQQFLYLKSLWECFCCLLFVLILTHGILAPHMFCYLYINNCVSAWPLELYMWELYEACVEWFIPPERIQICCCQVPGVTTNLKLNSQCIHTLYIV